MGREAMSSESLSSESSESGSELERLLPLLDDLDPAERARIEGLLVAADAETQALALAYEGDAAALAACATTQRGEHPMLVGFADAVMARIAAEPALAGNIAPAEEPQRAPAPILRPTFGAQLWIGLAALFLGGLGLAILASGQTPTRSALPAADLTKVAGAGRAEPPPVDPALSAPTAGQQPLLASPARPGLRAERGVRSRRPIVPVDGRGGAQQRHQVLQDLLQMQGWSAPRRVPPLAKDERELDF